MFKILKVSLKQQVSHNAWIKRKIYYKYNVNAQCKFIFFIYIKLIDLSTTWKHVTYSFYMKEISI